MLTVSRSTTLGAINRKESRGGHTRDDFPKPVPEMGTVNFVQRIPATPDTGGVGGTPSIRSITVDPEPIPVMPDDLQGAVRGGDLMAETRDDSTARRRSPAATRGHHAPVAR